MTAIAQPDDSQAARHHRATTASAPRTHSAARPDLLRAITRPFRPYRLSPEDITITPSEVACDLEYGRD